MHRFHGVRRITAGLSCLMVILSSCSATPERKMLAVQEYYSKVERLTAQADITADYGERVYSYTVVIDGNIHSGKMTVLSPENITGTVLQWSDGDTVLEYDGVSLETGKLTASGLSPADAVPVLLRTCAEGSILSCSQMDENILFAELENPLDSSVTLNCTFDSETMSLSHAELYCGGQRVLDMAFTELQLTITDQ